MINAILLAVMLAIVALNVVAGPRGYRLLAEAGRMVPQRSQSGRMSSTASYLLTPLPLAGGAGGGAFQPLLR